MQPYKHYKITVPCSTANLGPGYDVAGASLSLYLTLDVQILPPTESFSMTYEGEGAEDVPLIPEQNLITKTALYVLSTYGKQLPPIKLHVNNPIPLGRGLGSSGAAVVGGVMLADVVGELGMDKDRMLDYCLMIERHPDNVAAALVGGFVASYLRVLTKEEEEERQRAAPESETEKVHNGTSANKDGKPPAQPPRGIGHYMRLRWASEIRAIVVVPQFEVSTAKARAVLPETYVKKDVIFNLQRLAVLTAALAQSPPNPALIYDAMTDRLHQPYRMGLVPGLAEILANIRPDTHPGLLGICLSGAGPTVLALATDNFENIGNAVQEVFKNAGHKSFYKVLELVEDGAQCRQIM
ncbi:uncharacterized protein VTP21DRAFT_8077 [Calcarisporiella thermophila]|uniref:uncharacterized protein n=1 Tax=Calcarisporiella thermophila TaxID=911321 RepID=UPI003743A077